MELILLFFFGQYNLIMESKSSQISNQYFFSDGEASSQVRQKKSLTQLKKCDKHKQIKKEILDGKKRKINDFKSFSPSERDSCEQKDSSDSSRKKGRPKIDKIEEEHLLISRQYNPIIYRCSRFIVFLYLMKEGTGTHALSLQNDQSKWMKEAYDIMNIDNFPNQIELRKQIFLLHPNSLHFLFAHNKLKQIHVYSSNQIKYYFFAFLIRRNLFTTAIYTYITQYWKDIICLLGEWKFIRTNVQSASKAKYRYVEYKEKESFPQETRKDLEDQLKADPSRAAYQIACYLKSCCDYFKIEITSIESK